MKAQEGRVYEQGKNTVVCIGTNDGIIAFTYPKRDNISRVMKIVYVRESDLEISGNSINVLYPIRIPDVCMIECGRKGIFAEEDVRSILDPKRFSELEKKFNHGEIVE
jgi:hypothetical protein